MIYANIKHSKELKDLFPDAEWWWINQRADDHVYVEEEQWHIVSTADKKDILAWY